MFIPGPNDVLMSKILSIAVPAIVIFFVGSIFWGVEQEYRKVIATFNASEILYLEKMASGAPWRIRFPFYATVNNCLVTVFLNDRIMIRLPGIVTIGNPFLAKVSQDILYSQITSCEVKKIFWRSLFILRSNKPDKEEYYSLFLRNPAKALEIFKAKGILINDDR